MKQILTKKQFGVILGFALIIFGAGVVTEAAAQTKRTRPAPAVVKKPVETVPPGTGIGGATGSGIGGAPVSGIGGATGSGVSGATGTGTGSVNGSGTGTPAGTLIVAPSGNSAGQPSGSGTGSSNGTGAGTGSGNGTGSPSGEGIGTGTGTETGSSISSAPATPAAATRTYLRETNGRCFYVTNQGGKRYVARSNCALFPK